MDRNHPHRVSAVMGARRCSRPSLGQLTDCHSADAALLWTVCLWLCKAFQHYYACSTAKAGQDWPGPSAPAIRGRGRGTLAAQQ